MPWQKWTAPYPFKVKCACGAIFTTWEAWADHYRKGLPPIAPGLSLAARQKIWAKREAYHNQHKSEEIRLAAHV